MRNAVIVADMQRGFMSPEGTLYCGDDARRIIPRIAALVEREAAAGSLIVFTIDTHAPDDKEFAMWPPHCIAGTSEVEIIPELAALAARHTILHKRRYSAFFQTDLAERLAAFRPDRMIAVGDCTDICVLHTVVDARARDYPVDVYADCVASFDAAGHAWALQYMAKVLGVQVIDSYPQIGDKSVDNYRVLGDISAYVGDDGAQIVELAGRSTGLTSHSLAYITHPAGTSSRAHHHTTADEVYLVRSGQGRIEIDGETRTLGPGDVVTIRPGQRHKVWGDAPDGLALTVTCAPAYQISEVAWDE